MLIKKTFQGEIPENKILNMESNSETDTYSCDYINKHSSGIILYDNPSGTHTTITLSDDMSNYSYIEIFGFDYGTNAFNLYTKILSSQHFFTLINMEMPNTSDWNLWCATFEINGNTITRKTAFFRQGYANRTNNAGERMKITRVVGYK